jgi:AcrR family transcriptional regulator
LAKAGRAAGRPRRPETDDAILSAALALFMEGGLDGASFEQVARRAGVTRATIYRRWSSREALVARALGRLKEQGEEPLGRWQDVSLETMVGMIVEHGPKGWIEADARRLLARIMGSVPDSPQLIQIFWDVYAAPRRTAFNAIVSKAKSEGILPEGTDPDVFQTMLGGAVMYKLLLEPGEKSEEELRAFILLVLRQLGLGEILDRLGL